MGLKEALHGRGASRSELPWASGAELTTKLRTAVLLPALVLPLGCRRPPDDLPPLQA